MDREGVVHFSPKDEPLREDVHVLGDLLGEVLQEQGGAALLERVETARQTAINRREGDPNAEAKLTAFLGGLDAGDSIDVVRAFSAYFSLVNLAERVHRLRRKREYDKEEQPQPGSMFAVISALKSKGVTLPKLQQLLARVQVNPVFTAHPTEAVRRSLLVKEQRIARSLVDRIEAGRLTKQEELVALGQIKDEVSLSWQTEEHLSHSPVVADEVEHVLFYVSEVIYRVLPVFYEELSAAIEKIYGSSISLPPNMIRFGSWVGGDMDGNPNVGPKTILATLSRQREVLLKKYLGEVRGLFDRLSQSQSRVGISGELQARLSAYQTRFSKVTQSIPKRYDDMPYRLFLWFISSRIEATERHEPDGYSTPEELRADLLVVEQSLIEHRGDHAGKFRVTRALRRVESFGFYGASLDVRQDTLVHRRCVGALLGDAGYFSRSSSERQAC
jgi:phosphoenolpyruvate carboxylase